MGTSGLIFALLRRVLPYIYIRSLDSTWLAKGMAFTSPESDLDSSLDGQLISSPWEGTSHYPSLPETNQVLYPAWLPLLQILISFPIRTFHFLLSSPSPTPNPNPPHPPPPPRYGRFLNRWFTFFLREGLWQKHMALDSNHLNERRGMCAGENWNIPSLGPLPLVS